MGATLTKEKVKRIKRLYAFRRKIVRALSRESLAKKFQISRHAIDKIVDGKNWNEVV